MKEEPKDADFVLITHDHYDHFSPEDIGKVSKADTILVVPEKMAAKVKYNGGGIKLKEHRLFATKEEAEVSIPKTETKYRSPYE